MARYQCKIAGDVVGETLYKAAVAAGTWGGMAYSFDEQDEWGNIHGNIHIEVTADSADTVLDQLEAIARAAGCTEYSLDVGRRHYVGG
jgi:hypothetical protein